MSPTTFRFKDHPTLDKMLSFLVVVAIGVFVFTMLRHRSIRSQEKSVFLQTIRTLADRVEACEARP